MRGVSPGIRFYPITFTPTSSKYANEECQGVFMVITNRAALQPVRVGLEIVGALSSLFGARSTDLRERVAAGGIARSIAGAREGRAKIPRPVAARLGAPTKRAGVGCARSICCIADRGGVHRCDRLEFAPAMQRHI